MNGKYLEMMYLNINIDKLYKAEKEGTNHFEFTVIRTNTFPIKDQ